METLLIIIAVGIGFIALKIMDFTRQFSAWLYSTHIRDQKTGKIVAIENEYIDSMIERAQNESDDLRSGRGWWSDLPSKLEGDIAKRRTEYYRYYFHKHDSTTLNPVFAEAAMAWEKLLETEAREKYQHWFGVRWKTLRKDILDHHRTGKLPKDFQISDGGDKALRELVELRKEFENQSLRFDKMLEANLRVFRGELSLEAAREKYEQETKGLSHVVYIPSDKNLKREYEEFKESTRKQCIEEWEETVKRAEEQERQGNNNLKVEKK
ncbi:MAG: hypothetical protein WC654_06000 [Patescibacteria group bacterium]